MMTDITYISFYSCHIMIIDPIGRKRAIMIYSVVFVLGGLLQALATNLDTMMAGRFIAGRKF